MLTSSSAILHSASASPSEFREPCGLQSPRDWRKLLPPFSPATSSHSTQSSSSWRQVSSVPTVHVLRGEDKQESRRPSSTPRTNVGRRSLFVDTSEAPESQPLCQPQSQGTQQGSSNIGIKCASSCLGGETAVISNTGNPGETDRDLPIILPSRYDLCPVEHMAELISHMLGELIATNNLIPITSGGLTRFHSRTAPGISVRDYLHRLTMHAALAPSLLLAMVFYADRLCALYQEFSINTLTVHRFLIAAATVAAKGLSDSFCRNRTYARVGGVAVRELKILELELLHRLDWRIVPDPEDLSAYYTGLVERTTEYEFKPNAPEEDNGKP